MIRRSTGAALAPANFPVVVVPLTRLVAPVALWLLLGVAAIPSARAQWDPDITITGYNTANVYLGRRIGIYTYDHATLNFYGAAYATGIIARGSSNVNLTDGTTYDFTLLDTTKGVVGGNAFVGEHIWAQGSSLLTVNSGIIAGISQTSNAQVTIKGGIISKDSLLMESGGTASGYVNLIGTNFVLSNASAYTDYVENGNHLGAGVGYLLTGILSNGTTLSTNFFYSATTFSKLEYNGVTAVLPPPNIPSAAPEPPSAVLLGLLLPLLGMGLIKRCHPH